ncbi:hypothetical protein AXG93_3012s1000 [Marchantia polymorpha subsp. ruderalis]|uniref:Uncharacterized protein n=1 Tax=Marchantia polymorpha subsp. ruderalis TaxID=1480154 RepID=A0A176VBK9_MARPO|nr:hypothetical protein AXG93_3012s1000 [Marchantia polymorpha subsp. ruderalis]
MATWLVKFVERAIAGKPIHWARILWFRITTRQHIGEAFGRSVYYLHPYFINFYRDMGLLTANEEKQFLLETEKADDEEILGGNEVSTEEDDTSVALPSAKVDKSEDEVSLGTVDLDGDEEPLAEESKSVGLRVANMLGERIILLLKYLDGKMAKYAKPSIVGSDVKLVRSRTQTKVVASVEIVERKSLAAEKDLLASLERDCESLWIDIENVRKAIVDLRDRLKVSRVAFNDKLSCIDEMTADLAKQDHLHAVDLAAKAKELVDCEAARSLELEQREKLDANCMREVLKLESDKGTEEEDDTQAEEISRRAARGPVRVEVVITEEESERRPAKRQKVAEASSKGQRPEARMEGIDVTRLRTPKRRARLKKKANCKVVVCDSLEGSVAMTEGATSTMDEDTKKEMNLWTVGIGPSEVQNEDLVEKDVEPLEQRTPTTSQVL